MDTPDLLPVRAVAAELFRSEQGVRRLIKTGKLDAIKDGGRLFVKRESIGRYAAGLPHPPVFMALLLDAYGMLSDIEKLEHYGSIVGHGDNRTNMKYLRRVRPLYLEAKVAVLAKDYERAERVRHRIWQEYTDYQMLHAPIASEKPQWAMDMLFPDDAKE